MQYIDLMKIKFEKVLKKEAPVILAIESSCDETAASVIAGEKILSDVVASQIDIHKRFGGVVPEIASRNHAVTIPNIVEEAMSKAGKTLEEIDLIAVTYGAGLQGALLIGVSFAKALSYAAQIPLVAINHIRGHIAVNYLIYPEIEFPYLCLVVSGGNSAIIYVKNHTEFEILGETQDDACGECFDKVARVLGLPYPGGPEIEKIAQKGNANIVFPSPAYDSTSINFSFSGLKTAVINYIHKNKQNAKEVNVNDVAASFQEVVFSGIVENLTKCYKIKKVNGIVLSGGVASNLALREKIREAFEKENVKVYYPPLKYCTDNAVMIAGETYALIKNRSISIEDLDLDVNANLDLGELRINEKA